MYPPIFQTITQITQIINKIIANSHLGKNRRAKIPYKNNKAAHNNKVIII